MNTSTGHNPSQNILQHVAKFCKNWFTDVTKNLSLEKQSSAIAKAICK